MNHEHARKFTLWLQSRTCECDRLFRFIEESLDQSDGEAGIDRNAVQHLKIVAEELVTNAINHGYKGDPDGTIQLVLSLAGDEVHLTMTDSAPEFNPFTDYEITPGQDHSEGGMGILLIKSLTNEQSHSYANGRNTVRLTKHQVLFDKKECRKEGNHVTEDRDHQ